MHGSNTRIITSINLGLLSHRLNTWQAVRQCLGNIESQRRQTLDSGARIWHVRTEAGRQTRRYSHALSSETHRRLNTKSICGILPDITKTKHKQAVRRSCPGSRSLSDSRSIDNATNVFVALGSNIGDSIGYIEEACRLIDNDPDMAITDTSCLYDTKPMYVEDQARFINGACEIKTTLEPSTLLHRLQDIEKQMGRVKIVEKGPRNVDLDIIGYGESIVQTESLTIPHALMHERAFVLHPLRDLHNGASWKIPSINTTVTRQCAKLDAQMSTVVPLGRTTLSSGSMQRTLLMAILNVTPDSFSDGGNNYSRNMDEMRSTCSKMIRAGADIIDIGGQSSRPHAADITVEEELSRTIPVIQAIKSMPDAGDIVISIDTYTAAVAEEAVKAGAHLVNDISGGMLDDAMLPTIARLGCSYAMMHMRGTPSTMSNIENCAYPAGVVSTVAAELEQRIAAALAAGIRRWRLILDPGIGFAKNTAGNLELLRSFADLKSTLGTNIPWLVGSSRKKFIGDVTGVTTAKDRGYGTATTVTAAIAGGADIVRVHDVAEMQQVIRMADAIYRS